MFCATYYLSFLTSRQSSSFLSCVRILLLVFSVLRAPLISRGEREREMEKKNTSRRQVREDNISQNNLGTRVTTAVESAKRRITLLGIKEVSRKKVQNVQQVRSCQTSTFTFYFLSPSFRVKYPGAFDQIDFLTFKNNTHLTAQHFSI